MLIDAFGAQYGWTVEQTLNLTLDEIYLIQDAMIERAEMVRGDGKPKAPGSARAPASPGRRVKAHDALTLLGVTDE